MKKISAYQCKYCKKLFEEEVSCALHEIEHPDLHTAKLVGVTFEDHKQFPASIEMQFECGRMLFTKKYYGNG